MGPHPAGMGPGRRIAFLIVKEKLFFKRLRRKY
jgi:hypothetical protein